MSLKTTLIELHKLNFAPRDDVESVIEGLLYDYDLLDEARVPEWYRLMFKCVSERNMVRHDFNREERRRTDTGSVLCELEHELGWLVEDTGEEMYLKFPGSGVSVTISYEGDLFVVKPLDER